MNKRTRKLGLGTVQFGMDYGISNQYGQPSEQDVREILETAGAAGIRMLDTAFHYGKSEEILGRILPAGHFFQIVTKTPVFEKISARKNGAKELKEVFLQSLKFLKQDSLYGLMIHHAKDLLAPGGEYLFGAMQDLRDKGLVKKIGVSVYEAREIEDLLERYSLDLIQVPVSVLDQRLLQAGYLEELKRLDMEVHARSVFLQGLLLMDSDNLPEYFTSIRNHLEDFHSYCSRMGTSALEACLDFALELPEIDRVLVGVCSREELKDILCAANTGKTLEDYTRHALYEEKILNPRLWPKK